MEMILDVLDFRLRPPLKSFLRCGFFVDEGANPFTWHSDLPPSIKKKSWPLLREELKAAGVTNAVVWGRTTYQPERSTTNEDVASIVEEHGDLFVAGFGGICPQIDNLDETLAAISTRPIGPTKRARRR